MTDIRSKKSVGKTREDRKVGDRNVTESRELTEGDRVEMFRQSFFQSALPDLPKIPGYHTCWLTTTNPRDSLAGRLRLGYEPIKPEEVPGWEYATQKTGDYVGMIGVNEMLAFKLPEDLYKLYMREAHHDAPLREEQKLRDTAEAIAHEAEKKGARLQKGEGLADIVDERDAEFEV
jgi:hypothetical protein|tara:strand:+ start:6725 stop:7252 length:528 start_codon:yes stop_codon:yes gene_type:complete